eukprot:1160761-Pelagomonas_calceolata.AAC.3
MARLCRALVPVGSLPCKAAVALFAASRAAAWCPGVPDLQVAGYRKRRPQVKTIDCSPDLPLPAHMCCKHAERILRGSFD